MKMINYLSSSSSSSSLSSLSSLTCYCVFTQDFLKHLLKEAKKDTEVTEEKLIEYTDTMVRTTTGRHGDIYSETSISRQIGIMAICLFIPTIRRGSMCSFR